MHSPSTPRINDASATPVGTQRSSPWIFSLDRSPKLSELEARIALVNEQLRTARIENEALQNRMGVTTPAVNTAIPPNLMCTPPRGPPIHSPSPPLRDDASPHAAKSELTDQVIAPEAQIAQRDDASMQRTIRQAQEVRELEDRLQRLEGQLVEATTSVTERDQQSARRTQDAEAVYRANVRQEEDERARLAEFQKAFRDLRSQIEPLECQRVALQQERDELKMRGAKAYHIAKQLSQEIADLVKQELTLSTEVDELERVITQSSAEWHIEAQRLCRLISEVQAEITNTVDENKSLQGQIEQRRGMYRQMQDQIVHELDELGLKLAEARELIRVLTYERDFKEQRDAAAEVERHKRHMEETKAVAAERAQSIARAKRDAELRLGDLTREKDEAILSLQGQLGRVQQQIARQAVDNQRQDVVLQALSHRVREMRGLSAQNVSIIEQNKVLYGQVVDLTEETAQLHSSITSLKSSLAQRGAELANARKTQERMRDVQQRIADEKWELSALEKAIKSEEDRSAADLAEAARRHEVKLSEFEEMQSAIAKLQKEKNQIEEASAVEMGELHRHTAALRVQLSEADRHIQALGDEIVTKQRVILRNKEENARLERGKQGRTKAALDAARAVVCELNSTGSK